MYNSDILISLFASLLNRAIHLFKKHKIDTKHFNSSVYAFIYVFFNETFFS